MRISRALRPGPPLALGLLLATVGCASSSPSELDVWHTSALRPGRVSPETRAERELLARLDSVPAHEPVNYGDQVFVAEPPYAAASGRDCRSITIRSTEGDGQVKIKLACEDRTGWVFVPDPFAARVATQVPPRESQP